RARGDLREPAAHPTAAPHSHALDFSQWTSSRLSGWVGLPPGRCPGVSPHADPVGHTDQRAGLLARQGILGSDLAPLEPIEHLLEPHLDPLVLRAVTPGYHDRGDPDHGSRDEQER